MKSTCYCIILGALFCCAPLKVKAEALLELPDDLTTEQLELLQNRVSDLQNAADTRNLQAESFEKFLQQPGDCGPSITRAKCLQGKIESAHTRMNLLSDEAKSKLQQEITPLELQLSGPKALRESAKNFSQASGTLKEMLGDIQARDFSWKEHFGVIGKSILLSMKELLTPGPIIAISAGMAGYGVARATSLNQDSHDHFSQNPTPTVANHIGNQIGYAYPILAPFLIVAIAKKSNDTMLTFDELVVGTALVQAITAPLKYIVGESRPNGSDNLGFPSAHAAQSFMMATVLDHRYGHKVGILSYFLATGVALIRAGQDFHSPGQLLAGAGIGIATGLVARSVTEDVWNEKKERSYWKSALFGQFRIPKTDKTLHCVPMMGLAASCNLRW